MFRKFMDKITHYETFIPQTNPRNPNPWQSLKRYDAIGKGHINNVLDMKIETPHVHDPMFPGGVRPAEIWELTK